MRSTVLVHIPLIFRVYRKDMFSLTNNLSCLCLGWFRYVPFLGFVSFWGFVLFRSLLLGIRPLFLSQF